MPGDGGGDRGRLRGGGWGGAEGGAGIRFPRGAGGGGGDRRVVEPPKKPPRPNPWPAPRAKPGVDPTTHATANTAARRRCMIAFLALRPPRSECSRSTGEDFIHIALIDAVLRIWFSVHKGQPAADGAHPATVRPRSPAISGVEAGCSRRKGP